MLKASNCNEFNFDEASFFDFTQDLVLSYKLWIMNMVKILMCSPSEIATIGLFWSL